MACSQKKVSDGRIESPVPFSWFSRDIGLKVRALNDALDERFVEAEITP